MGQEITDIRTGHMLKMECFVQNMSTFIKELYDIRMDEFAYVKIYSMIMAVCQVYFCPKLTPSIKFFHTSVTSLLTYGLLRNMLILRGFVQTMATRITRTERYSLGWVHL